MRKRIWIFFIFSGLMIFVGYLYLHRDRGRIYNGTEKVFIKTIEDKPQIFRNGKPFYIKGASGNSYIKELSEAGGNTLRVYDTINLKAILDEALKNDIAVIVDIYLPRYNRDVDFYTNSEKKESYKKEIRKFIRQYKGHPSILIWNLGNELIYPLRITKNDFIETYNSLIDLIHEEDPDHLVSTTVSGTSRGQTLGLLLNSPKLDLIGFNAFGSIPTLKSVINELGYITKIKPYYISEWGIHGPWEAPLNLWWSVVETNSNAKGETYKRIYQSYIETDTECLGSLVFYWGYKQEGTLTWFNIFDNDGRKSQAYYDLKSVWTGEKVPIQVPIIDELKLNDTITKNLVALPDSILNAEVSLKSPMDSLYTIQWSIHKQAWGKQKWTEITELGKEIKGPKSDEFSQVSIRIPHNEGPYRLFVSIFDGKGNFATANKPFYVLARE